MVEAKLTQQELGEAKKADPLAPGEWDPWSYEPLIYGGEVHATSLTTFLSYVCSPKTRAVRVLDGSGSSGCLVRAYGPVADHADPKTRETRLFVERKLSCVELALECTPSTRALLAKVLREKIYTVPKNTPTTTRVTDSFVRTSDKDRKTGQLMGEIEEHLISRVAAEVVRRYLNLPRVV